MDVPPLSMRYESDTWIVPWVNTMTRSKKDVMVVGWLTIALRKNGNSPFIPWVVCIHALVLYEKKEVRTDTYPPPYFPHTHEFATTPYSAVVSLIRWSRPDTTGSTTITINNKRDRRKSALNPLSCCHITVDRQRDNWIKRTPSLPPFLLFLLFSFLLTIHLSSLILPSLSPPFTTHITMKSFALIALSTLALASQTTAQLISYSAPIGATQWT